MTLAPELMHRVAYRRYCASACGLRIGRSKELLECHSRNWFHPDEVIDYAFDAGDSLRRDNKALTLAIIGDNSVQFGDAVLDDHVDMRRPILFRDCGHDAVTDRRIVASRRTDIARKTGERVHQVGAADNADYAAVAGHRDALNAMALHHIDDRLERFVFV